MRREVTFMQIIIFSKLKKGILWKKTKKKKNKQTKTATTQNSKQFIFFRLVELLPRQKNAEKLIKKK